MARLKMFSDFMDEPVDVAVPSTDADAILELGTQLAERDPELIVFVEGRLQKWGT